MTRTVDPDVRLKGNIFARPDYFRTDPTRGSTRTPTGIRICALSADFLTGFQEALSYECGKSARSVLKSCGTRWGSTFATRFEREIATAYVCPAKDLPAGVVHACLADAFAYHGWGRMTIDLTTSERGAVLVEVADPVLPALATGSDGPADDLLSGFLAAVLGHFAGAPLDAIQTDCPTRGATASRFVVGSASLVTEVARWVGELAPTAGAEVHDQVVRRLLAPATGSNSSDTVADQATA